VYNSSGNRTPGSRFYSVIWIPWQTPFASTSSYSSVIQSVRLLVKFGLLTFSLFQHDNSTVQLIKFDSGQHEDKTLLQHCH